MHTGKINVHNVSSYDINIDHISAHHHNLFLKIVLACPNIQIVIEIFSACNTYAAGKFNFLHTNAV